MFKKREKQIIVLSLGGSLMFSDNCNEINVGLLNNFKKIILKNSKKFKFVIVTGGGVIARTYINALKKNNSSKYLQGLSGIASTRLNARFLSYFFDKDPKEGIPHNMKQIKKFLKRNDVIFCGALKYEPNETSDATSVKIANYLNAKFINITNVDGLYDKDPKKFKNAKFIKQISNKELLELVNKMTYQPGQHFIIDHGAARIIYKSKVKTVIIGKSPKNLDNLLNNKDFKGTIVY